MPRRLRDWLLGAALLVLPLLFLWANVKAADDVTGLDRLLLKVSAPIEAVVTGGAGAVHRGWRRYLYLVQVEQRNERLARERTRLRRQLGEANRRLQQLERYERLLAFRAQAGVETVTARVIARPPSPFLRIVRVAIDRGQEAVQSGMPVVTADGVVGRVGRTFAGYAEVVLAVDPASAIDVVVPRTGARGLLRGIDGSRRYRCSLDYLLREKEVAKGDVVVTSGAAGVFPEGLPVGRVGEVAKRTVGLYQDIEVEPAVDFALLKEALVIVAPPPPPVEPRAIVRLPARGITP